MDRESSDDGAPEPTRAALIPARDAVALLGVRTATLYAYVSRGLVRSVPGLKRRDRLYVREDVDRLRARHEARAGHTAVASDALRFGQPVLDSAITRIGADDLHYRGCSVAGLVGHATEFEAAAELLWTGEIPAQRPVRWSLFEHGDRDLDAWLDGPARNLRPMDRLALAIAFWAAADDRRDEQAPALEHARARTLLARMPAALASAPSAPSATGATPRHGPGATSVAHAFARAFGLEASTRQTGAIDACLVLCADHELNASTFAARVGGMRSLRLHLALDCAS